MEQPAYPMRINKYLALKNYATRGGADALVEAGLVFVNGKRAVVGQKVEEKDKVDVKLRKQKAFTYIAYNKPKGIITHSAGRGEKEIKEVMPVKGVFPVGRLDKDSHGLIILTDDGRITERLLGPKFEHEKEYFVKTKEKLRSSFEKKMEAGVVIGKDEKTAPCKVHIFGERAFSVTLTEGKKHQIRRMCDALFQSVEDLKRTRVMNITLGTLKEGEYRKLEGEELQTFLKKLGLV